jgi:hypothetical protein
MYTRMIKAITLLLLLIFHDNILKHLGEKDTCLAEYDVITKYEIALGAFTRYSIPQNYH